MALLVVLVVGSSLAFASPVNALGGPCSQARMGQQVSLSFDGNLGSSVQLLRDGTWLRNVTGTTSTTDESPAGTTYILRFREGQSVSDVTCTDAGPVEPVSPVEGGPTCSAVRAGSEVILEFAGGPDATSLVLRRDGRWLATVTGSTSFTDDDSQLGAEYLLRVRVPGSQTDIPCTVEVDPGANLSTCNGRPVDVVIDGVDELFWTGTDEDDTVIVAIERQEDFISLSTEGCLLYTSPSPRDRTRSRMPSSA